MRSITRLFSAFATLADSIFGLASVVDVATGKLRHQLALENVEVIEHQPAGVEGSGADQSAPETAPAKRGSKRSA